MLPLPPLFRLLGFLPFRTKQHPLHDVEKHCHLHPLIQGKGEAPAADVDQKGSQAAAYRVVPLIVNASLETQVARGERKGPTPHGDAPSEHGRSVAHVSQPRGKSAAARGVEEALPEIEDSTGGTTDHETVADPLEHGLLVFF